MSDPIMRPLSGFDYYTLEKREQKARELDAISLAALDDETGNAMIWLGSLSGYTIEEDRLLHRCGWEYNLAQDVPYLANIIMAALQHRKDTCHPEDDR